MLTTVVCTRHLARHGAASVPTALTFCQPQPPLNYVVRTLSSTLGSGRNQLESSTLDAVQMQHAAVQGNHTVIAMGQYSQGEHSDNVGFDEPIAGHDKTDVRMIAVGLGPDFRERYPTVEICDLTLSGAEGPDVLEHALLTNGALSTVYGEVDFISSGSWTHGFFTETSYHIFDTSGSLLRVSFNENEPKFVLDQQNGFEIPFNLVKSISVTLSSDWTERSLNINLDSGRVIPVVVDSRDFKINQDDEQSLLEIMVITEWIVKAAGGITLQLIKCGADVRLHLPKVLTAAGNPMVEMRNSHWKRLAKENL